MTGCRRWSGDDDDEPIAHPGKTDISVEEALRIMDHASFRLSHHVDEWSGHKINYTGLEILHEDKWKQVSRTDLIDDIGTTQVEKWSLEKWMHHYRSLCRLGARYDDKHFSVIDAYTDG